MLGITNENVLLLYILLRQKCKKNYFFEMMCNFISSRKQGALLEVEDAFEAEEEETEPSKPTVIASKNDHFDGMNTVYCILFELRSGYFCWVFTLIHY